MVVGLLIHFLLFINWTNALGLNSYVIIEQYCRHLQM